MKYFLLASLMLLCFVSCHFRHNDVGHFEKLIYHSSCYCPDPFISLEIDSDRTVKLSRLVDTLQTADDTAAVGYFCGRLDIQDYRQFLNLLQSVDINGLEFNDSGCCTDSPMFRIIAYYDHKRKALVSTYPPGKANDLISFLRKVSYEYPLTKTTVKFNI